MKGKISIIVPVYGEDEYLDACIESIVKQTYHNLEIILVDDGSPDRCPQICDAWALKDERIKVIHKQNGGLVSARQAGMMASSGEYIGYVDGDDWIESDMYEHMMEIMEHEKTDIVMIGFKKDLYGKCVECINPIPIGTYRRPEIISEIFPKMICSDKVYKYGLYTYVWNKLFKRDIIYQNQLNVDKRIVMGEDLSCVYPTILEAGGIAISNYTGYHYRQRMNSLLRKKNTNYENIEKLHVCYHYLQSLIKKTKYKDIFEIQLYYYYINHLIMMSDNLVEKYPQIGENFPFLNVLPGSKIIIYGAGAYGIHVYRQFEENKNYEIVAWVDPDYEQYDESQYKVESIEKAIKKSFDYLIIASVDSEYVFETQNLLKRYKETEGKIISINQNIDLAIKKLKENRIIDCEY